MVKLVGDNEKARILENIKEAFRQAGLAVRFE
jgi:hypothetical protein